ncbi:MAG: RimK family protein [Deltaproteobacteria bacterium]|nr:RimK family protein [Deltaproteobacteria bacterium]
MSNLVVVNNLRDWPLDIPGVSVVEARDYLTDPQYTELKGAKIFNLCRSFRYQSIGYYVSLLAAARGHKPMPGVSTIQDLKTQAIIRVASDELDTLIQKSLAPIQSREFTLSIYFGRNLARRHDPLSLHIFKLFQAPLLRAVFILDDDSKRWELHNINPISAAEIPAEHHPFVVQVGTEYFKGRRHIVRRRPTTRFDLAILYNPEEENAPSDPRAIEKFSRAAESVGMSPEIIDKDDYGRLAQFDALFIRETTSVNHHTYRFARRAAAEGLVVVDDPESILRCTNKVYLAESLERHRIATPRTVIVHWDNVETVTRTLGLPCILKQPDSSFSQGVVKVETEEEYMNAVERLLAKSELIIAQEFLPTDFDWRVGIFDRHPLYVCRYYMARAHWQIIKRDSAGNTTEGRSDTLPVEHAPDAVLRTASRAANLIGDGFYGVDLKQVGDKIYVIEVNDNPSVEHNVEDKVLKDELYHRIMRVMLRRVEERKERGT